MLYSVFLQARRRRLLVGHLLRGRVPTLAGLPGIVHPRLIRRVFGVDVGGGVVLRRSEFPFASPAYSRSLTTTNGLSVLFVFPERRPAIRICLLPLARVTLRRSSTEAPRPRNFESDGRVLSHVHALSVILLSFLASLNVTTESTLR